MRFEHKLEPLPVDLFAAYRRDPTFPLEAQTWNLVGFFVAHSDGHDGGIPLPICRGSLRNPTVAVCPAVERLDAIEVLMARRIVDDAKKAKAKMSNL